MPSKPLYNNPLKQEHCDCLDKILESVPMSLEQARACEECGLDMGEYIAQLEQQQAIATRLKAKFFPNRL